MRERIKAKMYRALALRAVAKNGGELNGGVLPREPEKALTEEEQAALALDQATEEYRSLADDDLHWARVRETDFRTLMAKPQD